MNCTLRSLLLCLLVVNGWAAANVLPTISAITDRTINQDANTGDIQFTITGDVGATLNLTRETNNTTLTPIAGITFGGSGTNRTVKIVPAVGQHGNATITIQVSDGQNSASTTFQLTVNAPPSIAAIAEQFTNIGTPGSIQVTLSDADNSADGLGLTARSGNTALVLNTGFAVPASGNPRSLVIAPVPGATGTVVITLTVTDGRNGTSERSFNFTINALPTISAIDPQTTDVNVAIDIPFTIGDADGLITALTLSATSSNGNIIPNAVSGSFTGTGAARTLRLSPSSGATGTVTITLQVSDARNGTTSRIFSVLVNGRPTISSIDNRTVDEDAQTFRVSVNVGDDGGPGPLTLTASSSPPGIVSTLQAGGTLAARTLDVTLVPNAAGTANITVLANDGRITGTATFSITVRRVADVVGFALGRNYFLDTGYSPLVQWLVVADRVTLASDDVAGGSLNQAQIRVEIINGLAEDELSVRTSAIAGIKLGSPNSILTTAGIAVGTWAGKVNGTNELVISLASTVTSASLTSVIGAICYENLLGSSSTARSDRTVELRMISGGINSNKLTKTIVLKAPNNAPTYLVGTDASSYHVDFNASKAITTANLSGQDDVSVGATLRFFVVNVPQSGFLRLRIGTVTVNLGVNDSFSQADLENGSVSYLHNGGRFTFDAAQLKLSDGEQATDAFQFPIRIGTDRTAAFISNGVTSLPSGNHEVEILVSKALDQNAEVALTLGTEPTITLTQGGLNQRGQQIWKWPATFLRPGRYVADVFVRAVTGKAPVVGIDHLHMVIIVMPPLPKAPLGGG